jgi:hypothetical protein
MNPLVATGKCMYCKKKLKTLTKTQDWYNRCSHLKCHNRAEQLLKMNERIRKLNFMFDTNIPYYTII